MCGRIFQTHSLQYILRLANCRGVRNQQHYYTSYNMGPTNYIPAIRRYDRFVQKQAKNESKQSVEEQREKPTQTINKAPNPSIQQSSEATSEHKLIQQTQNRIAVNNDQQILKNKSTNEQSQQANQIFSSQKKKQSQEQPNNKEMQKDEENNLALELSNSVSQLNLSEKEYSNQLIAAEEKKESEISIMDSGKEDRLLDFLRWGYQTKFSLIINARIEEAHDKVTFRSLINHNRCVVIAEGYYEWDGNKNPHCFKRKTKDYLLIAGIFSKDDQVMVFTRESFGEIGKIHHRMPVLLEDDEVDLWLNVEKYSFLSIADKILNQKKSLWLDIDYYRVGTAVNNIKDKSSKCIQSWEDFKQQQEQKGIKRFFKPIENSTNNQQVNDSSKTDKEKDSINKKNSLNLKRKENTAPVQTNPSKRTLLTDNYKNKDDQK